MTGIAALGMTVDPRDDGSGAARQAARRPYLPLVNVPVWDSGRRLGLPSLAGDVEADVCVVGLGGSGLAAVHALLDLGARVVGLDAGVVAGAAAGRNGGFLLAGLAPFHHDAVAAVGRARAVALYRLTLEQLDRMAAETPDAVRRVGSLRIAASAEEERDCERQLAAMRADDLPAEPYDGPEGRGLLVPTDGAYHPQRRCHALAERAVRRGARLFERTTVVDVRGDEVATAGARVRCGVALVMVDGALEALLPELAGRARSARLQMLATAPERPVRYPRPVYSRWGYDYWQQLDDGRVVLGGCRDLHEAAEWTRDAEPSPAVQSALDRLLRERLGVVAPVTHRWAATVAYTADGLPVCEEVRPRVFAAGAYSGTGNVVGALCGRALAQLAVAGRTELDALLSARPAGS
jgi:glycine/D-amino acid oxidase-like deaminating enzyme